MIEGRTHLAALLEQQASIESVDWVRGGLRRWLLSGTRGSRDLNGRPLRARRPSLARFLALPESPERARLALRDVYLLELARCVAESMGGEPWAVACELQRLAHEFEGRKWPCWCDLDVPPAYATEAERLLWFARRMAGSVLPGTARRYRQLIGDTPL